MEAALRLAHADRLLTASVVSAQDILVFSQFRLFSTHPSSHPVSTLQNISRDPVDYNKSSIYRRREKSRVYVYILQAALC